MTKGTTSTDSSGKRSRPRKLSPTQIKAIDSILEGMTLREVAECLGVSRQTVSDWKNHHSLFKAKLEELRAAAEEDLRYTLPMIEAVMLGQLRRIATTASDEVRLKAIQYFFDRLRPTEASSHTAPNLDESDAMILSVMRRRHDEQAANASGLMEGNA